MIGLIVDGEGDFSAFKARYGSAVLILKADGPRGHSVSEQAIVNAAKKQIAMLSGYGCSKIGILTDFEGRTSSREDFCLRGAECAKKIRGVEIFFLVADQMIENWYLSDISFLSTKKAYLRKIKIQKKYESSNGKKELKKLFKHGFDYNEVRHGAELFPLVRREYAVRMSSSFATFCEVMGLG